LVDGRISTIDTTPTGTYSIFRLSTEPEEASMKSKKQDTDFWSKMLDRRQALKTLP